MQWGNVYPGLGIVWRFWSFGGGRGYFMVICRTFRIVRGDDWPGRWDVSPSIWGEVFVISPVSTSSYPSALVRVWMLRSLVGNFK